MTSLFLGSCLLAASDTTNPLEEPVVKYNITTTEGLGNISRAIACGDMEAIKYFSTSCVNGTLSEDIIRKASGNKLLLVTYHTVLATKDEFEAFAKPAVPPTSQIAELSPFIAISVGDSVLPSWMQETLKDVRTSLGKVAFASAQSKLLDTLKVRQKATIDNPLLKIETAFFVRALPVIQKITSELHDFLLSMNAKSKSDLKSDVEKANRVEVNARMGLVYSLFDAIFGKVDTTQEAALFIMCNSGAIKDIDNKEFIGISASKGLDENSEFMKDLRAETKLFTSHIIYLSSLISDVYKKCKQPQKSSIIQFSELNAARTALETALEDEFCMVDAPDETLQAAASGVTNGTATQ